MRIISKALLEHYHSAKGHNVDHIVHFADAAQTAILVERSLHADFFVKFGVSREKFETAEPTPVCEHYISYMIRVAALEPFEVLLAALLPCFWIYREVGRKIHERAAPNNPYQAWIDTYAGQEFEKAVDSMLSVVDDVARDVSPRTLKGMHHAFRRATQLEWMFWNRLFGECMACLVIERLEGILIDAAKNRSPLTYQQVAQLLELRPPHTIHQAAALIESMMRYHAKVGAPQLASLVISRARGGLPAPGFFMLLQELSLYDGAVDGEDARQFHAQEMQRCFS